MFTIASIVEKVIKDTRTEIIGSGVTEAEYAEHLEKFKSYLTGELNNLLNTPCNVAFVKKYIQYSARNYIQLVEEKNGKTVAKTFDGNGQLTHFLEARIFTAQQRDEKIRRELNPYLKSTILNEEYEQPTDEDEQENFAVMAKELVSFLVLNKVNRFWSDIVAKEASKQEDTNEPQQAVSIADTNETTPKFKEESDQCDPLQAIQLIHQIDVMMQIAIQKQYRRLMELLSELSMDNVLVAEDDQLAPIIRGEDKIKLPAKFVFNTSKTDDDKKLISKELDTVVKQYNTMQQMRHILHQKGMVAHHKVTQFDKEFKKQENQDLLKKDTNGLFDKIFFAIENLLNSGVRGTLKFWKNETEIVKDMLCHNYVVPTKTESNHRVISSRSRQR